jgi:hypothetical protein
VRQFSIHSTTNCPHHSSLNFPIARTRLSLHKTKPHNSKPCTRRIIQPLVVGIVRQTAVGFSVSAFSPTTVTHAQHSPHENLFVNEASTTIGNKNTDNYEHYEHAAIENSFNCTQPTNRRSTKCWRSTYAVNHS